MIAELRAIVDDNLVVWLSRVIAQDVNIFDGAGLLASSERNLFASGLNGTLIFRDVFSDIDGHQVNVTGRRQPLGQFSLFGFSAKFDPVASMLVQNHRQVIPDFYGLTTSFRRSAARSRTSRTRTKRKSSTSGTTRPSSSSAIPSSAS